MDSTKVDVAIFDSGFEKEYVTLTEDIHVPPKRNGNRLMRANHGTSVASLFNGPWPYGTTDNLNLINLTAVTFHSMYSYAFRNFEKNNRYPRVISNSLGWTNESAKELAQKADERGILWFLASGNSWPEPVREYEASSKALLVGSFSPSGLTSYETQSDNRLLVHAAANEELPAIDGKGEYHLFGATSGATPIVAATVTNLLSLIPALTKNQIIKIVKATAFKSIENKLGNRQAPGLLNAYKAFRVVARIQKACPLSQAECLQRETNNKSNYQFGESIISCAEFKVAQMMSLTKGSETLTMMRKSLLLTKNSKQALALSCAYRAQGFAKNAEFYNFLASEKVDLKAMQEKASEAIKRGMYQISYYRYLKYYTPSILQDIDQSEKMKSFHKDRLRALY